ncbi:MAG: hypothetical protein F6J87_22625 [Spirulina sp. SIO3F2]|nr:hypothetical protein [Spirulina sp. SIO3F2]
MKYFFLSDGWQIGRVWEQGGKDYRRRHKIQRLNLGVQEGQEVLWLYAVEDNVLMLEVTPGETAAPQSLGQVILKRLIDAEAVIARLNDAETLIRPVLGDQPS